MHGAASAGVVRNNCMNNTATVGDRLRLHGVNSQVGLCQRRCFQGSGAAGALPAVEVNRAVGNWSRCIICALAAFQVPLVLATSWSQASKELIEQAVQSLKQNK